MSRRSCDLTEGLTEGEITPRLDDARSATRSIGRAGQRVRGRLESAFGGADRTRVIVLLAGVLALSSADSATVGASATQLRRALGISNTDIGVLVAANSVVAAAASLPFGILADRVRRTRILAFSVLLWGVAMLWSATAGSFGRLLFARLFLGVVVAAAGPVVASLVGDYFPSAERGRIYSYVLTGELLGAGVGFAVAGDVAALSWRAAFVILALPTFVLARFIYRLPEPARGGTSPLQREGATHGAGSRVGGRTSSDGPTGGAGPSSAHEAHAATEAGVGAGAGAGAGEETDAQRIARLRGIASDPARVLSIDARTMGFRDAARYMLGVRSNVVLIVASACGYFYLSGVETFAVEFVKEQYGVNQALANVLILFVGVGAVIGVLAGGALSDLLLHRRYLNARILVPAIAALGTTVFFIPAIATRSVGTALPYLCLAALTLTAQNPPIDAARLDIIPPLLWGRAEGIRTFLRTAAQSVAPVMFGGLSDLLGGGRSGLQWTFAIMLLPLAANGLVLFLAMRSYPRDVATAAAGRR